MNKRIKKKRAAAEEKNRILPRITPKVHTPPRITRPIKGPAKRKPEKG